MWWNEQEGVARMKCCGTIYEIKYYRHDHTGSHFGIDYICSHCGKNCGNKNDIQLGFLDWLQMMFLIPFGILIWTFRLFSNKIKGAKR